MPHQFRDAQTQARADLILMRMHDLEFIQWEDLHGSRGPGTPLDYLCMGGFGVVHKGQWMVSGGGLSH